MVSVAGIIPARLDSSRLPGKLLLAESGKPLIQHTWESANKSTSLQQLLVATESESIANVVRGFGGVSVITNNYLTGTDRVASLVRQGSITSEIVVNIQGDEPEIPIAAIDGVVSLLLDHPNAAMSTVATPIRDAHELRSTDCVKVVLDAKGRALYFSRLPIPFLRDEDVEKSLKSEEFRWLRHVGLYAYRSSFLVEFAKRPSCMIENAEKLEQLRALEMGAEVRVVIVDKCFDGIDTRQDYERFVWRQKSRMREVE
ncbi:MAG: 3-deoxy-manno-octulosonate cytidylyltransferase [Planctomycetota bacterium]